VSETFTIEVTTETLLLGVVKDLSRIRQWVAGFEAAGGKGPAHKDALWRAQQILGQARRDSGRLPEGENSRSEVEGEAPQSGGTCAASPNPSPPETSNA
jgi:hypothetical protein